MSGGSEEALPLDSVIHIYAIIRRRPRSQAQCTESTPRLRINSALVSRRPMAATQLELRGAVSHLDLCSESPVQGGQFLIFSRTLFALTVKFSSGRVGLPRPISVFEPPAGSLI